MPSTSLSSLAQLLEYKEQQEDLLEKLKECLDDDGQSTISKLEILEKEYDSNQKVLEKGKTTLAKLTRQLESELQAKEKQIAIEKKIQAEIDRRLSAQISKLEATLTKKNADDELQQLKKQYELEEEVNANYETLMNLRRQLLMPSSDPMGIKGHNILVRGLSNYMDGSDTSADIEQNWTRLAYSLGMYERTD